jgi:hypothetical protein
MRDYYCKHDQRSDPFNWIQVHPFMDEASQKQFPIDHACKQEMSLMMTFCPEGIDLKKHHLSTKHYPIRLRMILKICQRAAHGAGMNLVADSRTLL